MKLDKQILEEKIREYRKFKSCSESTLMGLCETAEYPISQAEMVKLGCGFAGGVIDDPSKIKSNAKEIFNTFKEEYGSVCCGTITDNGKDKSPCVDCCVFIANKVADLWDE